MKKYLFTFISIISFVITTLLVGVKFISNDSVNIGIREVFMFVVVLACLYGLLYLALFDLKHYEIPSVFVYVIISLCLLVNLGIIIVKGFDYDLALFDSRTFTPVSNIAAALVAGSIFGMIVLLTKEKGMGIGDLFVAIIMGLTLGLKGTIVAFYISLFSALLVGLTLAFFQKKFKNLAVPFVPFMTFGIIVSFLFWPAIWNRIVSVF